MRLIFIFLALFSLQNLWAEFTIWDVRSQKEIDLNEFRIEHQKIKKYILGEYHYDGPIQKAQAEFIESIYQSGDLSLMWEFLNFTEQKLISKNFENYKLNRLSDNLLLKSLNLSNAQNYLPLFKTLKKLQGKLCPD